MRCSSIICLFSLILGAFARSGGPGPGRPTGSGGPDSGLGPTVPAHTKPPLEAAEEAYTVIKAPSSARGHDSLDQNRYMGIRLATHILKPGDSVRALLRLFEDVEKEDYDIIQIGALPATQEVKFAHFPSPRLYPKHPFWLERENYQKFMRILHLPNERKVVVSNVQYIRGFARRDHKLCIFSVPQEFLYNTTGYYLEITVTLGDMVNEANSPHILYLQGQNMGEIRRIMLPNRFGADYSQRDYVSIDINVVEAYRGRLGKRSDFHGDNDRLFVESMGYPMPYFANFHAGGLYLGLRAHFAGFFSGNVVAHVSTPFTTHEFFIGSPKKGKEGMETEVRYKNKTEIAKAALYNATERFGMMGSLSFINMGKALAIVFNVPHHFNYALVTRGTFRHQVVQFDLLWDGPVTEIVLYDEVGYQKAAGNPHDYYFKTVTNLHHVEIDNELLLSKEDGPMYGP